MTELKPYHVELLIQEIAKRKSSNSRYSLRAFARFLGIAPSTLSRVLANHQELSISGSKKIMRRLKFTEEQKITFITSVAEEKKRRAILNLARGLESIGKSHDFGFTLEGVVDMAVSSLADACIINICRADNLLVVHAKHKEELFKNFYENTKAIRQIVDQLCPNNVPCLVRKKDDPKGVLDTMEASSLIIVPLTINENLVGSLTLIRSEKREEFSEDDLQTATALSVRVILASGFNLASC